MAFYYIGVGVVATVVSAAAAFVALLLWARFINGRFNFILFRKGERRLSVAAWHSTKIATKSKREEEDKDGFLLDDWPVNERPLYLSYKFGRERRLFILAGIMDDRRHCIAKGKHP